MYIGSVLLWGPAVRPGNSDYRQSGGTGKAQVIALQSMGLGQEPSSL